MKKIFLLMLIMLTGLVFAKSAKIGLELNLDNYYTNNVLKLSDHDLNRFESGEYTDKFELETSDDMITSFKLNFWGKTKILGHTNQSQIGVKFDKYLQNDFKDEARLELCSKQFLSKKVNFELGYQYYPEIYVNRYASVLETDGDYYDFTYSKNQYNFRLFWKPISQLAFKYRLEYSQLFYNKYFTEYDADNNLNNFIVEISSINWFKLSVGYGYKVSIADAGSAFDNLDNVAVIKDASYEANIYTVSIYFPQIMKVGKKRVSASISMKYEEKFFDSKFLDDSYHVNREDYLTKIRASVKYKLSPKVSIRPYYEYEERDTESSITDVERNKSYNRTDFGLSLNWDIL